MRRVSSRRFSYAFLRILLLAFAAATGGWAAFVLPTFWWQAALNRIGARIAEGEPFKPQLLWGLKPQLDRLEQDRWLSPTALHNLALIEVRLAEMQIAKADKISDDPQISHVRRVLEQGLRVMPLDAFMWFASFWLIKLQSGVNDEALSYLRMSYLVGAHEGWIAVRRSANAVPLLVGLPDDLRKLVIEEFANLVASDYTDAAADILIGPGWGNREVLLEALTAVPENQRRELADAVYDRGVDVSVPGIERRGSRPWR